MDISNQIDDLKLEKSIDESKGKKFYSSLNETINLNKSLNINLNKNLNENLNSNLTISDKHVDYLIDKNKKLNEIKNQFLNNCFSSSLSNEFNKAKVKDNKNFFKLKELTEKLSQINDQPKELNQSNKNRLSTKLGVSSLKIEIDEKNKMYKQTIELKKDLDLNKNELINKKLDHNSNDKLDKKLDHNLIDKLNETITNNDLNNSNKNLEVENSSNLTTKKIRSFKNEFNKLNNLTFKSKKLIFGYKSLPQLNLSEMKNVEKLNSNCLSNLESSPILIEDKKFLSLPRSFSLNRSNRKSTNSSSTKLDELNNFYKLGNLNSKTNRIKSFFKIKLTNLNTSTNQNNLEFDNLQNLNKKKNSNFIKNNLTTKHLYCQESFQLSDNDEINQQENFKLNDLNELNDLNYKFSDKMNYKITKEQNKFSKKISKKLNKNNNNKTEFILKQNSNDQIDSNDNFLDNNLNNSNELINKDKNLLINQRNKFKNRLPNLFLNCSNRMVSRNQSSCQSSHSFSSADSGHTSVLSTSSFSSSNLARSLSFNNETSSINTRLNKLKSNEINESLSSNSSTTNNDSNCFTNFNKPNLLINKFCKINDVDFRTSILINNKTKVSVYCFNFLISRVYH